MGQLLLKSKTLLDAVHVEAARIFTGRQNCAVSESYPWNLVWNRSKQGKNKHILITFYKIVHGLAPNYLLDLVPPIVRKTNTYALRNADHIQSFRLKIASEYMKNKW